VSAVADVGADPLTRVWDALEAAGCNPHGQPWKGTARCPAHDDKSPSLTIGVGADGRALVHCHAGCPADDVVDALGLAWSDLFPPGHHHARRPRWLAKPRAPVDVVLDAVREHGLDYRCTVGGELWVVEACPACRRDQLWIHEERDDDRPERPGRVRLCCMAGCEQHVVLAALAEITP
jgi:hypothetical protein